MKKRAGIIAIIFCLMIFAGLKVYAAELTTVRNAYSTEDSLVVFVENQGRDIESVYLGSDEAREFLVEDVGTVRTVVVLDNSLSIDKKYRDAIKGFLTDLAAARKDGDTFTIATFAKDITYLVEDSNDYLDIKGKIDALQFEDQLSYFSNVLYTVLEDVGQYKDMKYTRIIVIADGVDNETLGYTDEELNRKVQAAKIPVYTIGCVSDGNEENLKKMFAISRKSNAKGYLLDDLSGNDILQDIIGDTDISKVTIVPQDKSCDGTSRMVRISYGGDYCQTEMIMPFKAAVEETPQPEEPEKPSVPVAAVAETDANLEKGSGLPDEDGVPYRLVMAISVAVALTALLCVMIMAVNSGKRKKRQEPQKKSISGDVPPVVTRMQNSGGYDEDSKTALLIGGSQESRDTADRNRCIKLFLQDMDNPSRTFEYPVRDKVLIGRNANKCQVVIDYSEYISSVHCEVIARGKQLYVRDGGGDVVASSNGTFVNGQKAAPELALPSKAVLKLGPVRFRVIYQ